MPVLDDFLRFRGQENQPVFSDRQRDSSTAFSMIESRQSSCAIPLVVISAIVRFSKSANSIAHPEAFRSSSLV